VFQRLFVVLLFLCPLCISQITQRDACQRFSDAIVEVDGDRLAGLDLVVTCASGRPFFGSTRSQSSAAADFATAGALFCLASFNNRLRLNCFNCSSLRPSLLFLKFLYICSPSG